MFYLLLAVGIITAWILYTDFVYPHVVYPLIAWWHKGARIPVKASRPLGIPGTLRILKELKNEHLLQYIAEKSLGFGVKTTFQQNLGKWVVFTREPENIKAVLSTKFNDFSLVERNKHMRPVIGSGIFTQDGKAWKHSREMLKPQFTKDQISRLEGIAHHVDTMIERIHELGGNVELQHFFHLMTMDTATHFLFGESVDSLKIDDNFKGVRVVDPSTGEYVDSADFVESYTWLNNFALKRILMNDLDWITVLTNPDRHKHMRRIHIYLDHYAKLALESTKDYVPGADEMKGDYIFSYELAKGTRDLTVIRDQCFNILIAGRDTTASSLSFAFHFFVNNPEVWQKVREDVWSVFPDGDTRYLTYDDLRKPKYLQMVIKEVLRLQPAVPLNMRTAVRDTHLPRGGGPNGDKPIFIPKGMTINYPTYVLHRDPDIYGENANQFVPERWAPENRNPSSAINTWGYIPFNGGPRICLGQQFALTEIALTIIKLALAFKNVEPGEGFSAKVLDKNTLTVMVGGAGVPVRLTS